MYASADSEEAALYRQHLWHWHLGAFSQSLSDFMYFAAWTGGTVVPFIRCRVAGGRGLARAVLCNGWENVPTSPEPEHTEGSNSGKGRACVVWLSGRGGMGREQQRQRLELAGGRSQQATATSAASPTKPGRTSRRTTPVLQWLHAWLRFLGGSSLLRLWNPKKTSVHMPSQALQRSSVFLPSKGQR